MIEPWHYAVDGQERGPIGGDEIRRLLGAGAIGPQTLLWTPGLPNWVPLSQTAFAVGLPGFAAVWGVPPHGAMAYPGQPYSPVPGRYAQAPGPAPWRDFGEAIGLCLSKYVVWAGRASRSEYWWFYLFCSMLSIGASVLDVGLSRGLGTLSPLSILVNLGIFLPQLSVTVRRLHDTDRSGWWLLFPFACILAGGVLVALLVASDAPGWSYVLLVGPGLAMMIPLVFMLLSGTPHPNRYG